MNTELMFSSKTEEWYTPLDFFQKLDAEFHFNLDPCATDDNHKCKRYFTREIDGLRQSWGGAKSFVIPHMERLLASGLRRLMKKIRSQTH